MPRRARKGFEDIEHGFWVNGSDHVIYPVAMKPTRASSPLYEIVFEENYEPEDYEATLTQEQRTARAARYHSAFHAQNSDDIYHHLGVSVFRTEDEAVQRLMALLQAESDKIRESLRMLQVWREHNELMVQVHHALDKPGDYQPIPSPATYQRQPLADSESLSS